MKPILAIVGRPNVGKSALFNRICQKRVAIVDEAEGVTRDRLYAEADAFGFPFLVVDTGGIDPQSTDQFQEEIRRQAEIAIEEADAIVMVVDGKIGVTELDHRLAQLLLKTDKPLTLAINKIDDPTHEDLVHEFYGLGITRMLPVSATQSSNIAELLEMAWKGFKKSRKVAPPTFPGVKISVIGRPNVGKSTLVNTLINENRCVVSPIPGTTRDSIDIPFTVDGKEYVLIDTAGIRRKKAEHDVVDKFAAIRTERAIERSDVCLLVLDVQEGLTAQEKRIANLIEAAGKGCIVLLNKWDLVKGFRMEHCQKALQEESPFLGHCPLLVISALNGRNLEKLFSQIDAVHSAMGMRVPTPELNKFVERAVQAYHPPMLQGKRLRIYYMTQVEVSPPKFILFVNKPELMTDTYKKYLINQFRTHYAFSGAPLTLELRGKEMERSQAQLS